MTVTFPTPIGPSGSERETATASPAALPAGYAVVHSRAFTLKRGKQTHGTVMCPAGTKPVSGGETNTSQSTAVNLNSSYPTGSHSWAADVNNASGATASMTVYAVCMKRPAAKFTVTSETFTNPAGTQSKGQVECPGGVVVGGGVIAHSSSTGVNVGSQVPGPGAWFAWMNNGTGDDTTFTVWAICRTTKPSGYALVSSVAVANPAGAQTLNSVNCPGATVPLSGGGFTSTGSTAVNMNDSAPDGQGWNVHQNNASTEDTDAQVDAVCAGT